MVHVPSSALAGTHDTAAPAIRRVRATSRTFWALFAVEGALLLGALLALTHLFIPARAPLSAAADHAAVRAAVFSRVSGEVADPLVEIGPGLSARTSSMRGFALNGQTYYYYFEGERSFDPLSRHAVRADQVEIVLRDDSGPTPLVIYALSPR